MLSFTSSCDFKTEIHLFRLLHTFMLVLKVSKHSYNSCRRMRHGIKLWKTHQYIFWYRLDCWFSGLNCFTLVIVGPLKGACCKPSAEPPCWRTYFDLKWFTFKNCDLLWRIQKLSSGGLEPYLDDQCIWMGVYGFIPPPSFYARLRPYSHPFQMAGSTPSLDRELYHSSYIY